ncbi:uncharacterized protein LOC130826780 [Amaranthus tricolor]|uniref:uncharacterized protein LOC130826780 n=1 Tax=Amaranthus tricolor TaxID=29722 RepID=UPI00258D3E9F|nr:uncharacterized protein LOC130826780 [Amaranthus tricolor]
MAAMATTMSNTFAILPLKAISSHNNFPLFFPTNSCSTTSLTKFAFQWNSTQPASSAATIRNKNNFLCSSVDTSNQCVTVIDNDDDDCKDCESEALDLEFENEIQLYSFNPLPIFLLAALPGADTVKSVFGPFVELVKSWNLPDWLVHWGHPGNMAVVLFAMGGYGTYLGFRIRFSDDVEEKAKAKDLHPKLLGGMFFFFALGATGGVTSLLTSDRPIFESPHAVTGFIGLALLTLQTILPSLFEGNPGLRNVHGILGSGIMTLFLVHAALGLQLGLSY